MYLPNWIQQYKEKCTEIRCIKGHYYKYLVRYQYNKEKKRTDKITVKLLGKITEQEGFIESDKESLRKKSEQIPQVDIKTFGIHTLFEDLMQEEIITLRETFGDKTTNILLSFSQARWAYQSPIKRVANYHFHDFSSEKWDCGAMSDKKVSETLRQIGEQRETAVSWMQNLIPAATESQRHFVMMDSTHSMSLSENLALNAIGYNPAFDFEKQIRLMYLFSAQLKQPVYYRLLGGNITDVKSMQLCVQEAGIKSVVFVADKGFFSLENINSLEAENMQYILPLHRNNSLIDFSPLQSINFKQKAQWFLYQNRVIWYYSYRRDGLQLTTFLDEQLRVNEEADYLRRTQTHPEKYDKEKFDKKLVGFGTFTVIHQLEEEEKTEKKTKGKQKEKQIEKVKEQIVYETYKCRNDIEVMFDSYKNYLTADLMYMQNRYVLEGWLFANFIAMIAYYKLYIRLKNAKLLQKYAPKDIIERSKAIYMTKIKGKWNRSEMTEKDRKLFKNLGIDYLK